MELRKIQEQENGSGSSSLKISCRFCSVIV
jgi:hypothetical protein